MSQRSFRIPLKLCTSGMSSEPSTTLIMKALGFLPLRIFTPLQVHLTNFSGLAANGRVWILPTKVDLVTVCLLRVPCVVITTRNCSLRATKCTKRIMCDNQVGSSNSRYPSACVFLLSLCQLSLLIGCGRTPVGGTSIG